LLYIFELEIAIEPAYIAIADVHVGTGLVLMATVIVSDQPTFDSIHQRLDNLRTSIELEDLHRSASIEHVAFACHDYDAVRDKLGTHGLEMSFNDVPQIGLRQIFVNEPNGITLEPNFSTG
jgi:hypothetical protein